MANAQRAGGIAAFIDAEHALDPEYAKALGVDTDALLVSQPDTGEQALEIADMLIRSGALDIIVIDSVAALVPRAEIEGEMGDSHVGLQARLMSQALRKITGALSNSGTTAIFINQLREKIGVMFGSPETTTGGRALKFYASVRLDVRRIETLKDGTDAVGNRTRVKVVKNKVAPPFKQAEFDIIYGQGISREGGLIDVGVEHGLRPQGRRLVHLRGRPARPGQGERPRRSCATTPTSPTRSRRRSRRSSASGRRSTSRADAAAGRAGRLLSRSASTAYPRGRWPRPSSPAIRRQQRRGEPDPHDVARQIVLRQLTMAPRSRAQLEDKLRQRDCPDDVAAAVLDRLTEVGLVDDEAYAADAGALPAGRAAGWLARALAPRAAHQGDRPRAGRRDPREASTRSPSVSAARALVAKQAALHARAGRRGADPPAGRDAGPQGLLPPRRSSPRTVIREADATEGPPSTSLDFRGAACARHHAYPCRCDGSRTYEVRTYGCQMNVHDSERLSGLLEDAGYVAAPPTASSADVVVFNTCAVRENADNKLYGNLGHLRAGQGRAPRHADRRRRLPGAEGPRRRSSDRAPWVDVVFGTHNIGSLPVLLERARHNDEAQVEILESLEVFPSTLPTRRESAYAALGVDLGRLQQHLHVLHRPGAARQGEGPPPRRHPRRDPRRWSPRASSRSPCSARTSTPTASSSATGWRSASCCAPAARSTGWSGSASPARTRRTSPTTSSRRWPRRRT